MQNTHRISKMSKRRGAPKSKSPARPSDKTVRHPPTTTFPLNKLPLELREQIWEQAILATVDTPKPSQPSSSGKEAISPFCLADISTARLYSLEPPSVAKTCHEALAVANRLQRKDHAIFEREGTVTVINALKTARKEPLVPLLDDDKQLVLSIDSIVQRAPDLLSLRRNKIKGAHRVLDLLIAAKDGQIKVCTSECQRFILPKEVPAGTSSAAVRSGWVNQLRLVSLNDARSWEELQGLEPGTWLPWDFMDGVLDNNSKKRKMYVKKTLGVLENFWKRENQRRDRHGLEQLGPLPEVDVVAWVHVMDAEKAMYVGWSRQDRGIFYDIMGWGVL